MPRNDGLERNYIKLEFEVGKPLAITRFSLFQFGTDYYALGHPLSFKYGLLSDVNESSQQLSPLHSSKIIKAASGAWLGNAPRAMLPAELTP